jgi:hypothetical protein
VLLNPSPDLGVTIVCGGHPCAPITD